MCDICDICCIELQYLLCKFLWISSKFKWGFFDLIFNSLCSSWRGGRILHLLDSWFLLVFCCVVPAVGGGGGGGNGGLGRLVPHTCPRCASFCPLPLAPLRRGWWFLGSGVLGWVLLAPSRVGVSAVLLGGGGVLLWGWLLAAVSDGRLRLWCAGFFSVWVYRGDTFTRP